MATAQDFKTAVQLYNDKKYLEAVALFEEMLRDAPDNPRVLKFLGMSLYHVGRIDDAKDALDKCLSAGEEDAGVCYWLGRIANERSDFLLAERYHREAARLGPRFAGVSSRDELGQVSYDEEKSGCELCGSAEGEVVWVGNIVGAAKTYGVINPVRIWARCGCGFIYSDPRPTDAAVDEWWTRYGADNRRFGWKYLRNDGAIHQYLRMGRERLDVFERFATPGRLLDIGASVGHFVAAALEAGWDACGVELMEDAVREATQAGLPVSEKNFLEWDFQGELFDAVSMWEVIEHVSGPQRFVERARRLLKPGGVFALSTPNPGSAFVRYVGKSWNMWQEPTHIHYFDQHTIRRLLEECGFDVLHIRPSPNNTSSMDVYARALP